MHNKTEKFQKLNALIKNFFEPKGYGVEIKKGDFGNAGDFCKFCESAYASGFGIVIGDSLFELGFLYGIGKPLILNNTPRWTKDTSEINNAVCRFNDIHVMFDHNDGVSGLH